MNSIAKNAKKLAREQRLLGLFADNLPVLRESFIYEVMTGGADTGNTDFWSKAAMLGLHFSYDLFFMLRIDFLPGGEGVPGARRSTIDDTLTQCVPAYCSGYHVVLQDSACYLLLNVDQSLTQDKTKALLDGLCQAILGAFTCAGIRVAVRQSAQGYGHRSWNRLYTQLSLCPAAQIRPLRHDQVPEYLFTKYKQGERRLFDAVAHQQMEYIHRFVDELIDQATTAALGPGALMKVCVSCYNEALKPVSYTLLLQGELDVLLDLPTLTGVSAWLRRVLGRTAQAVGQLKSKKNKGIVERVQRMIAAGFHTDIDVVSISARLNISPNYLRRIFKDYTGKSLSAYLCEYRIEKACQLLKDTDHKIADIPPMVGLENNPHFYYLIKKTTGLTPGQYRAL